MVEKAKRVQGRERGRPRGSVKKNGPHPIDIHVGTRLRLRRALLGMSQENLGEAIGITFQQVQKYERGANRISASRLFNLSRVLDVPVSFFFDDMPGSVTGGKPAPEPVPAAGEPDPMQKRETLELVRAYYRISDPVVRQRIFELTKTLAGSGEEGVSNA